MCVVCSDGGHSRGGAAVANREVTLPAQGPDAVDPGWHAAHGVADGLFGSGVAALGEQIEPPGGAEGHPSEIDDQVGGVLVEAVIQRGLQDREGASQQSGPRRCLPAGSRRWIKCYRRWVVHRAQFGLLRCARTGPVRTHHWRSPTGQRPRGPHVPCRLRSIRVGSRMIMSSRLRKFALTAHISLSVSRTSRRFVTKSQCGRSPAKVIVTSRSTAALEGSSPAAPRACTQ